MKRLFFNLLLLSSFFLTAKEPVKHGKEHDFMLVASPSSGSTFLRKIIRDCNQHLKCDNEYFTRIFKIEYISALNKPPYNSLHYKYIEAVGHQLPESYLENFYQSRWTKLDTHFTKEIYAHRLIDFFYTKFTLFALYRHRKYTFPTPSKQDYFFRMYESFKNSPYESNIIIKNIQNFLKKLTLNKYEGMCAAHIFFNYILLKSCAKYNIPVINYEQMMQLNSTELHLYMQEKIPPQLYTSDITDLIIEKRNNFNFLKKKEQAYQELGIESFCQKFIAFIKSFDPDMLYWHLIK